MVNASVIPSANLSIMKPSTPVVLRTEFRHKETVLTYVNKVILSSLLDFMNMKPLHAIHNRAHTSQNSSIARPARSVSSFLDNIVWIRSPINSCSATCLYFADILLHRGTRQHLKLNNSCLAQTILSLLNFYIYHSKRGLFGR